jgi:hypothetical protein
MGTKDTLISNPDTKTQDTHTTISSAPSDSVIAPIPPSTGLEEQILKRPATVMNELGRLLRPSAGPSKRDELESPLPYQAMPGGVSQPGPSMRLVRSPQPGSTVTPLSNIGTFSRSDTLRVPSHTHTPSSTSQQH